MSESLHNRCVHAPYAHARTNERTAEAVGVLLWDKVLRPRPLADLQHQGQGVAGLIVVAHSMQSLPAPDLKAIHSLASAKLVGSRVL